MGKGKSIAIFLIVVMLIGLLSYTVTSGLQIGDYLVPRVFDEEHGVRKGLDLVGGSVITFEAQTDTGMSQQDIDRDMISVVSMLRERLNQMGYFEATLSRIGNDRVRIEIPSVQDPEEAVQQLGSTAQLEMKDGDGNVIIVGSGIASATADFRATDSTNIQHHVVILEFTEEARQIFAATTEKYSTAEMQAAGKNIISIEMDGNVLSAPYFTQKLSDNTVEISGSFDGESAQWLANLISSGALPFSLMEVENRTVGPQLGEEALSTCITAGAIGMLIIFLFLIVVYRVPGFLASIVLVGYVGIIGLVMTVFRINLSLPGIAGIVLSIGMAIDANIIIFERIKEELRTGKSLRASIEAGFSRAFTAIVDANITSILVAGVLYYFGTGPIQGFAVTLFIGIIISMFTALVVTKIMLSSAVGMGIRSEKAYGA